MIALFQIFHGVWTLAFFVLTLVNTKTVLPNASCLLAGYLPATTVLHILLIPSDYPLPVSLFQTKQSVHCQPTVSELLQDGCNELSLASNNTSKLFELNTNNDLRALQASFI